MNIVKKFIESFNRITYPSIAVLGDLIIDEYYDCKMERISPEYPVPIIKLKNQKPYKTTGGGAYKVRNQINKFIGCNFFGFESLKHNIYSRNINKMHKAKIPIKKRYFCNGHQVARIDIEDSNYGLSKDTILENNNISYEFFKSMIKPKVLVISDYNKGFLTQECINLFLSNSQDIITIVDPKLGPASKWYGCTIFKPNFKEATNMTGTTDWKKQCDILMQETNCKACIITNEGEGVYYKIDGNYGEYKPDFKTIATSVVGAGDCFISFLAICQAIDFTFEESIEMAFAASSLYVQNTSGDAILLSDLIKYDDFSNTKIVNSDFDFSQEKNLVFTNGCFDAGLTPGHIECLKFAKKQGNKLVVALNSDSSVKRLKGESRPIYSLNERMKIVASLEFVDYVTWFEEDTPLEIIKKIKPKKIVKGGDYQPEDVVGKEIAEIVIFNLEKCLSTTEKLKKLNLL